MNWYNGLSCMVKLSGLVQLSQLFQNRSQDWPTSWVSAVGQFSLRVTPPVWVGVVWKYNCSSANHASVPIMLKTKLTSKQTFDCVQFVFAVHVTLKACCMDRSCVCLTDLSHHFSNQHWCIKAPWSHDHCFSTVLTVTIVKPIKSNLNWLLLFSFIHHGWKLDVFTLPLKLYMWITIVGSFMLKDIYSKLQTRSWFWLPVIAQCSACFICGLEAS